MQEVVQVAATVTDHWVPCYESCAAKRGNRCSGTFANPEPLSPIWLTVANLAKQQSPDTV